MTAALNFKIFTHDGRCFFAKLIREPRMAARAHHGLGVAAQLANNGLDIILPSIPAGKSHFIDTAEGVLSLYPYIDAHPTREHDMKLLGRVVAQMHGSAVTASPAPETHIPFVEESLAAVRASASDDTLTRILRENLAKLQHYLDLHHALSEQLQTSRVPTHSDIAGNILMPHPPAFLLIDWDEAAIAAPERDLWFLWTQPLFVSGYRDIRPRFTPDADALRHAALSFYLDGIGLQLAAAYQPWGNPAATAQILSERRLSAARLNRLDAYLATPPA